MQQIFIYLNKNYLNLFNSSKFVLILFICFIGCTNRTNGIPIIKTAKPVPNCYVNVAENNFSNHQDTIYLNQLKFSGFLYVLFPNKDTVFVKSYLNGLEEGIQKKWFDNKQLAEKRMYVDGKKEGLQQAWWPNGKHKFIYTAMQDEFIGNLKEWNAVGLLNKDFNYVNGQEEGSEKMWWDDGTIRANYVIRNGKKYGLLGIKICVNKYDSIINK